MPTKSKKKKTSTKKSIKKNKPLVIPYAPLAKAILKTLKETKGKTFTDLTQALEKRVNELKGSVSSYANTIIGDLEAKKKVIRKRIQGKPFYFLKKKSKK